MWYQGEHCQPYNVTNDRLPMSPSLMMPYTGLSTCSPSVDFGLPLNFIRSEVTGFIDMPWIFWFRIVPTCLLHGWLLSFSNIARAVCSRHSSLTDLNSIHVRGITLWILMQRSRPVYAIHCCFYDSHIRVFSRRILILRNGRMNLEKRMNLYTFYKRRMKSAHNTEHISWEIWSDYVKYGECCPRKEKVSSSSSRPKKKKKP